MITAIKTKNVTIKDLEIFVEVIEKDPLPYEWFKLTACMWLKWYIKFKRMGIEDSAIQNMKWYIEYCGKASQKRMGN